jgi:hypothetical protein
MKQRGKSPSERFVSAVIGFVAGAHMYGKTRPSTYSLMLESRKLNRLTNELRKKYGLDGKQG